MPVNDINDETVKLKFTNKNNQIYTDKSKKRLTYLFYVFAFLFSFTIFPK